MNPTTKEEFDALCNKYMQNADDSFNKIATRIAHELNINSREVYMWREKYINNLSISPNIQPKVKMFEEWVDKYHEPDAAEKVLEYNVTLKKDAHIVPLSDFHMGSMFLRKDILSEYLKKILGKENVYILILGDMVDYGPTGPQDLLKEQQLSYKSQRKMAISMADVIGNRVLACCSGCHSHFGGDEMQTVEEEFAEKTLTKVYLHDGGFLNLTVGNNKYRIFMTHKTRGGSYMNPSRALMRMHECDIDFDIGIEAHRHNPNITTSLRRQKPVTVINCGSFKGMDGFANKKGFCPKPTIMPGFFLSGLEWRVNPFMNWEDGLDLLD